MGGAIQGNPLNIATVVSTLAGTAPGADGIGGAVRFNGPASVVRVGMDLYVADARGTIRKIATDTGNVSTIAGATGIWGSADGAGSLARFSNPTGITTDGSNLYVVDGGAQTIRKIVIATNTVTTLAGTAYITGSVDGTGAAASFLSPTSITIGGSNLYVADTYNSTIRKIVIATGVVTTIAGTANAKGNVDGIGAAARFFFPKAITNDGTNLYVADSENNTIRKIVIATGMVTTFATSRSSFAPNSITTDGTNLYVADANAIYKVVIATGTATALAGAAGVAGSADGTGTAAHFNNPSGMDTDGANLYVADTINRTIRKIVIATNAVTTIAGTASDTDGTGATAGFYDPVSVTTDGTNLYVVDPYSNTIRKIVIGTRVVTTLAGTAYASGSADGVGAVARFSSPYSITTDGTNLYLADSYNNRIRKILMATGAVTTVAVTTGDTSATANFSFLCGITTDGTNLYLADCGNNTIRKVVITTGATTTLAGSGISGSSDGIGAAASFNAPQCITTDGTNLYATDANHTIRQIVIATGVVTTLAGTSGLGGSMDGTGAAARFHFPNSLTTDGTSLYVADMSNNAIRKIVIATGVVTTLAGSASVSGSADSVGAAASFNSPTGITTDGFDLFVTDMNNGTIRKIH